METYNNSEILDADTIKQSEKMKKKKKKITSDKRESFTKPNYVIEISSKG